MVESAYLSKRLDIRPEDLVEVASRWRRGVEGMRPSPRMARVSKGFWLDSEILDSAASLKVHGLVWTYGRPVRVILEFAVWSKTQSELGVCPRSLVWPVGTVRYVRRVLVALESMSEALCSSTHTLDVPCHRASEPANYREGLAPLSGAGVIARARHEIVTIAFSSGVRDLPWELVGVAGIGRCQSVLADNSPLECGSTTPRRWAA